MLPVIATKAVSVAIAGWITVSGAQVYEAGRSDVAKEIVKYGVTTVIRREEIAKHQIKKEKGWKIHSEGSRVAWYPKTAEEVAKKLNRQGWQTQVTVDRSNAQLRNVHKKKIPKHLNDYAADLLGNWVYYYWR